MFRAIFFFIRISFTLWIVPLAVVDAIADQRFQKEAGSVFAVLPCTSASSVRLRCVLYCIHYIYIYTYRHCSVLWPLHNVDHCCCCCCCLICLCWFLLQCSRLTEERDDAERQLKHIKRGERRFLPPQVGAFLATLDFSTSLRSSNQRAGHQIRVEVETSR